MTDTEKIVTCPACNKEMTKVYIEEAGINVDICLDGCGGILFNNKELERFDQPHENADKIFEVKANKTFEPTNPKEVRICTFCNSPMIKQNASGKMVEIDVCYNCGAKFLDHGELKKLRELNAPEIKTKPREEQIFKEDLDALINAFMDGNSANIDEKFDQFAKKHISNTNKRSAVENLIRKIIKYV